VLLFIFVVSDRCCLVGFGSVFLNAAYDWYGRHIAVRLVGHIIADCRAAMCRLYDVEHAEQRQQRAKRRDSKARYGTQRKRKRQRPIQSAPRIVQFPFALDRHLPILRARHRLRRRFVLALVVQEHHV